MQGEARATLFDFLFDKSFSHCKIKTYKPATIKKGKKMIGEIKFHGNWKSAGNRYTDLDFKILTNSKAQNRLIDKYKNTGVDFDFHFYKGPKSSRFENFLSGYKSSEWVEEKLGIKVDTSEDKIPVVVTSNIGRPKYPLTPWIIAHRMSHSLASYKPSYSYFLENHFVKYLSIVDTLKAFAGSDLGYSKWFGCAIGTSRCCRNRTLSTTYELFHELFAQRLLTGRVRLNRVENRILIRKRWKNKEFKFLSNESVDRVNALIDRIECCIHEAFYSLDPSFGILIV